MDVQNQEWKNKFIELANQAGFKVVQQRRKRQSKGPIKEFKAFGSLYKAEGDKILSLMQICIGKSQKQWGIGDIVRGIITEYLNANPDLEKASIDLVKGSYNT